MSMRLGNNPTPYYYPTSTGGPAATGAPTATSANVAATPNAKTYSTTAPRTDDVTTGSPNAAGSKDYDYDALLDAKCLELAKKAIEADASRGKAVWEASYEPFKEGYQEAALAERYENWWKGDGSVKDEMVHTENASGTSCKCKYNNFQIVITTTVLDTNSYGLNTPAKTTIVAVPVPTVKAEQIAGDFTLTAMKALKNEGYEP